MYELLVVPYDSLDEAEAARQRLQRLSNRYLVDVADAVVAGPDGAGRLKLEHLVDLWPVGLAGRAIWGSLAAVLREHPLVVGGAAGTETLADFGISDAFMAQVRDQLERHGALMFVLAREVNSAHVIEQLRISPEALLRSDIHRPEVIARRDPAGLGRAVMTA